MKKVVHHFKKHYHERYVKPHGVRAHIILTIDGILVSIILALLALGSYFAFYYNPLRDTFKIAFEIPEELRSGEAVTLGVSVTNDGKEPLEDFDITVFFPPQFQVYSTADISESTGQLEVGSLGPGETQSYQFQGLLLGPPAETIIYAKVRGQREYGAEDERFASAPFVWQENAISMDWNLPEAAVAGQTLPFAVRIGNDSAIHLDNLRFKPNFPRLFRVVASSPPIGVGGAFLGEIPPGESAVISIAGRLSATEELQDFSGELVWGQEGEERTIARIVGAVQPIDVDIDLAVSEAPSIVRPGETFGVKIAYANNGDDTLRNVRIRLPLDPQFIDIPASSAVNGGRTDLFLAWESVTLPELTELRPGDSGELESELVLRAPVASFDANRWLKLYPEIHFDLAKPELDNVTILDTRTRAKIAGEAELAGVARYFTNEGEQIGRGPLPPRVGAETKYWIVLKVDTGSTKTTSSRVTIDLPPNVKPTGKSAVTAGFELQPTLGGLIWNIGDIEAFAGDKHPAPNASFEVALTPNSDQLGLEPQLMKSASFSGKDAWTGITLESTTGELSTNLSTDPYIKGRTVVK